MEKYVIPVIILILLIFIFYIIENRMSKYEEIIFREIENTTNINEKLFQIHNRLFALEKEKNIERRLVDVEKALRVYCTGDKLEMCGNLPEILRK